MAFVPLAANDRGSGSSESGISTIFMVVDLRGRPRPLIGRGDGSGVAKSPGFEADFAAGIGLAADFGARLLDLEAVWLRVDRAMVT